MTKDVVLTALDGIVSARIGHNIGSNHIHTDEKGWYYYIPTKSLQENHPLILNHYRGPLFMVIPDNDFEKLLSEEITVVDYIEESTWSFGYFWGGGSMLNGVHWHSFEEKGITDTALISKYLTILKCRTMFNSSGYRPETEECQKCQIEKCPVTKLDSKKFSCNMFDIMEQSYLSDFDAREDFCNRVGKRVKETFGFNVVNYCLRDGDTICLIPRYNKNTVEVLLPTNLMIDMMYNRKKYLEDTTGIGVESLNNKLAQSLKVVAGIPGHFEKGEFIPLKTLEIKDDMDGEFIAKLWKKMCPKTVSNWFDIKSDREDDMIDEEHDLSFNEKVVEFFKRFF